MGVVFLRPVCSGFSDASGPWCLTPPSLCHRWRCTLFSPISVATAAACHCCDVCPQLRCRAVCLMDLPVRFSVRLGVPPAELRAWALPLIVPGVSGVEAGWGWDMLDNGCFVLGLDVLKLCSRRPGDAWSNRDTQKRWKRSAVAHSPQTAMLPTFCTFWITTLATFHTYKSTLSHSGDPDICLLFTTKDFFNTNFFPPCLYLGHIRHTTSAGALSWRPFTLFSLSQDWSILFHWLFHCFPLKILSYIFTWLIDSIGAKQRHCP